MSSGQIIPVQNKADLSFFYGYKQHRSDYRKYLAIHIFEVIMFAAIIPIDYLLLEVGNKMAGALIIGAADSLISLIILVCVYNVFFVKDQMQHYCELARDTYHATSQPIEALSNSLEACTSTVILYSANGIGAAGVGEQTIRAYGTIAQQQIEQCLQYKHPVIARFIKLYNFLALLSMLLIIIMMATSFQLNAAEISVLIVFLLLQAYIKVKVMLILLVITLSPIIFIVFLCYVCCCKPKETSGMVLNLKPKSAGVEEVINCGECTVCLMDIKINEMVYQLNCSNKHIFHQGCLDKWSKVKPNCPTCRKDLPLTQPAVPA